jgi:hypothetical protein
MTGPTDLPFGTQRLVFFALVLGMTMYAIAVAVVLQTNDSKGMATPPIEALDMAVPAIAAMLTVGALVLRKVLQRAAEAATGAARSQARFRATLIPLAMLEAGCLTGLTAWLLNGNANPHLIAAMLLLAIAIAIVPLTDPDAK